jgi:hypothetical protein
LVLLYNGNLKSCEAGMVWLIEVVNGVRQKASRKSGDGSETQNCVTTSQSVRRQYMWDAPLRARPPKYLNTISEQHRARWAVRRQN